MKIIEKRFPNYVRGQLAGYYYECYGFRKYGEMLVIDKWVHNASSTYVRNLDTRTFEDTEAGRAEANEVYKQLRAKGYEVVR